MLKNKKSYAYLLLLLPFFLTGCSNYDRDFNCPSPGTGSCQPLDVTYANMLLEHDHHQEYCLEEIL